MEQLQGPSCRAARRRQHARRRPAERLSSKPAPTRPLRDEDVEAGRPHPRFAELARQVVGHDLRLQTPYGERPMIYADWCASGRLYRPLEERLLRDFGPYMANIHSETTATALVMTAAYEQARAVVKRHVNARGSVLIPTGTGTTGAIAKLQRLMGLRTPSNAAGRAAVAPEARPVVLVSHMEHHSNHTSWLECDVDVEVIPARADGLCDVEAIPGILARHAARPLKIASVSACSNVTGIRNPVHDIAAILHAHGGVCFADYACSAPYDRVDMHPADPARALDAIFFSPHKFLGGPGSSGILVFDPALYDARVPDHPGGGTVTWTNPWGGHRYVDDIEVREDGGTPGVLQMVRVAMAIRLKEAMGIERIAEREGATVERVFDRLDAEPRITVLAGEHRDRLPVFSLVIDGLHHNLVVRLLNDRFGIQARGGCACAGTYGHHLLGVGMAQSKAITDRIDQGDLSAKPGWVRLSLHPVTSDAEVEAICDALLQIARHGDEWAADYAPTAAGHDFTHRGLSPVAVPSFFD